MTALVRTGTTCLVAAALAGLAQATQFLRVLGCYPRAITAPDTAPRV